MWKNVAFIPVRGGSKSIPLKNIKELCGKPLVYWTIKAACECGSIDKVIVATDSGRIRDVAGGCMDCAGAGKVEIIGRSAENASDTASTESAMLEFARENCFESIVLVQATSPMLTGGDLDRGFSAFAQEGTDSVVSVVRQKRFRWRVDENGYASAVNYDIFRRPRRQEFQGDFVENGAFYITSRERLLESGSRISGKIKAVEMAQDTFFEIDESTDFAVVEALMKNRNLGCKIPVAEIKMFLTDCDGCLTDCGMYYSEMGDEMKKFHARDGAGFAMLKERGILTGIITGESVRLNEKRAQKLGVDILRAGCLDKKETVAQLCREYNISAGQIAYVGDDVNDLEVIKMAGYGCCPADAVPAVRENADYVCRAKGGQGAVREVIDGILRF